jgi:hypothetical protein
MTRDDDTGGHRIPVRMIGKHRQRIQEYRRRIQRLYVDREVSGQLHDDFAVEVLGYYDVLREFRNSDAIDDEDLPEIDKLRSRLGKTTTVVGESAGRGRGTKLQEVPAIREVSLDYLLRLSHELDDLAQQLGFAATPTQTTPHGKAEHSDLKGLLRARGQDEALDNLPGGSE